MAGSNRKDLYLQVSGNITNLQTAMKAGRSVINEFGGTAINVLDEVEKAFGEFGRNGDPAKQLEKNYEASFKRIGENARAVLNAPTGAGAVAIIDSAAAQQAAERATLVAAAERQVAEAASRANIALGGANEKVFELATASAAAAVRAEQCAAGLRDQAAALGIVEGHLETTGAAQKRLTVTSGQQKAGFQQLSYQLGDISTQYASGASASIIFAQQSGQVIQALQLISGESKGVIGLLGGPWGIAISSALVVLSPFVGKLFESSEASKEAQAASKALAATVDDIGTYFDKTTGKIKETNRALIQFAVLSRQKKNDDLRDAQIGNAKAGGALRDDSLRDTKPVFAERGLAVDARKTINFDLSDALKSGNVDAQLRAIATSSSTNAAQAGKLLEQRAQFAKSAEDIAKNNAEIRSLLSGNLDNSLKSDRGGGRGGAGARRAGGTRNGSSIAQVDQSFVLKPLDFDALFDPAAAAAAVKKAAEHAHEEFTAVFGATDPLGAAIDEFEAARKSEIDARAAEIDKKLNEPLARYSEELHRLTDDSNAAFQAVAAHGLAELEDGLVGVITGTESVGSAFKKMATSILADLARIAIEKAIVSGLDKLIPGAGSLFSLGGSGGGTTVLAHAAGGQISGPGTGTSDSILSWLSNGEFVVKSAQTAKYLPLLHAINDNDLPGFADGGLVAPAGFAPRLPRLPAPAEYSAQAHAANEPIRLVVTLSDDLHATIDSRAANVSVAVLRGAAPAIVDAATSSTIAKLSRPGI